jgi:FKBP-type peptidyl-prolyl cis-trans isomerase 2
MSSGFRWFVVCAIALAASSLAVAQEGESTVVKDGAKVGIEYTLKLEDGSVADTSEGGDPLVYQQGAGQILPALEQSLAGLSVGDEKQVSLTAEEGYGPIREDLYRTVATEQIPEDARVVGADLIAQDEQGRQQRLRVHEVRAEEDEIVLDLNHPLAGQALLFDLKVVSID